MGINEDFIELKSSDYERKLYDMKNGHTKYMYLVQTKGNNWEFSNIRPETGTGKYIEKMPTGECREYENLEGNEKTYHRV